MSIQRLEFICRQCHLRLDRLFMRKNKQGQEVCEMCLEGEFE